MLAKRRASQFSLAIVLIIAWAGGIVYAGGTLARESTTAGAVGQVPVLWPTTARYARRSVIKPTLVLALHPKCACSAATVTELSRLMARFPDRIDVQVLVRQPQTETWEASDRETTLAALPGVTLINDHGGTEAARFGALTSGQVILFDVHGREVFAGGLTATRGHEGSSVGAVAIATFLTSGVSSANISSVFGCALANAETLTKTIGVRQ